MKKILCFISVWLCLVFDLHAQTMRQATFQISFPDSTYRSFFDEYPNVDRLVVAFENEKAVSVMLYNQQDIKQTEEVAGESYDLEFEGDRYMFVRKYRHLNMPILPKLTIEYMAGIMDLTHVKEYYDINTTLYRDSVSYGFNQYYYLDHKDIYPYDHKQNRAKYKGDVSQLEKMLERNYKEKEHTPIVDSVLIFQGLVERDGSLSKVALVIGEHSSFSDLMLKGIQKAGKSWWPAKQGGTPVKAIVKFFVRLNSDESITASTSGWGWFPTETNGNMDNDTSI